jgi:hypothetical protein
MTESYAYLLAQARLFNPRDVRLTLPRFRGHTLAGLSGLLMMFCGTPPRMLLVDVADGGVARSRL